MTNEDVDVEATAPSGSVAIAEGSIDLHVEARGYPLILTPGEESPEISSIGVEIDA